MDTLPQPHRPSVLDKIRPDSGWKLFVYEFALFGLKQGWSSIFGGILLCGMLLTYIWYPFEGTIHRYDFLFLLALGTQALLILFKLEHIKEILVILLFHVVATFMEIFKTHPNIGSWTYPEEAYFKILTVPLFTGFMYSAVGSYIARVWRAFDFHFTNYPSKFWTALLALGIYVNFFTHHFIFDFRWILIAASVVIFGRSRIYFRLDKNYRYMPLCIGMFLVALFIWFAENIATFSKIWVYPNQSEEWHIVSPQKIVAWYLLMMISFVLVSFINRIKNNKPKADA